MSTGSVSGDIHVPTPTNSLQIEMEDGGHFPHVDTSSFSLCETVNNGLLTSVCVCFVLFCFFTLPILCRNCLLMMTYLLKEIKTSCVFRHQSE